MDALPGSWDKLDGIALPQAAQTLVGHGAVFDRLAQGHHAGRLHHGMILSGPRGIGKATLAYRFAAHLLSNPDGHGPNMKPDTIDPMIASKIAACAHPNVLTASRPYDAKAGKFLSRITVDSVREVTRFLQSTSGEANWRVVVIDSTDDMNASSANALLKILEEPPKRTMMFLLAHSPRGLLPTLRSRCQVSTLKPLSHEEVNIALDHLGVEGGPMRDQAVEMAGGSVRRAIELLQSHAADIITDFIAACRAGYRGAVQVHALASQLSMASKAADYNLFIDLLVERIIHETRTVAIADGDRALVDAWQKTLERVQQDHTQAIGWNLDKKQVILNAFEELTRCYGSQQAANA